MFKYDTYFDTPKTHTLRNFFLYFYTSEIEEFALKPPKVTMLLRTSYG